MDLERFTMKQVTKGLFVLIILCGLIVLPASASAQNTENLDSKICSALSERQTEFDSKLTELRNKFETAKQDRQANISNKRTKLDSEIEAKRKQADTLRGESQTLLRDKYSDETSHAADAYIEAVNQAVTTRRQAFDTAREKFRSDVDAIINGYTGNVDSSINSLVDTTENTYASTKKLCRSRNVNTVQTRQDFIAQLKKARQDYSDFRRNKPDISQLVKQAAETRNQAYTEAIRNFQQSMRSARELLKVNIQN